MPPSFDVSEILQLLENTGLSMATCLCHQNGRMECWNAGILGIKAEINHFNCKKLLSFNFVQDKLTRHFYPVKLFFYFTGAITRSFHYSNWGEAPKFNSLRSINSLNFAQTLTLQKSRIPQVQGITDAAVVIYRKALITQEMRYHRLS
jgi:hypothetical protein